MPSLEMLRRKWFLNFRRPDLYPAFPPIMRHRGSRVADYTDGNGVVLQVDGEVYMAAWYEYIEEIWNRRAGRIYHANLKMDDVRPLGYNSGPTGRECLASAAGQQGVGVYALLCRSGPSVVTANLQTLIWFLTHGVPHACLDQRFPFRGSNHQKFTCFVNPDSNHSKALVGSIDINAGRWDTQEHLQHCDLPPRGGRVPGETPTHDLGLMVMGPALADLEWTFIERWNDRSRTWGMRRRPLPDSAPDSIQQTVTPARQRRQAGTQSIQVLHTYGRAWPRNTSYSWCNDQGEYTIWASYLNAIETARHFIYIEDQYFVPFNWPPWYRSSRQGLREIDLIYQLGQRIRNGVKVVVLVPSATGREDPVVGIYFDYQRSVGALYLEGIAQQERQRDDGGDFVIGYLRNNSNRSEGCSPVNIYVHSKVMICDDEFVLAGSANVNRRSMTHDGEVQLGIVDAESDFVRDFRRYLWSEHLRIPLQQIPLDFDAGLPRFRCGGGRLEIYTPRTLARRPADHGHRFNHLADPYGGPPLS